jgi:Holliday junction DNA helicase RuvA
MISYLKGEIKEIQSGKVTLGINHGAHMIGYQVAVPQDQNYQKLTVSSLLEVFVVTNLRQDALELFGFFVIAQKTLFLELLNVSGIGPKSAMNILSSCSTETLIDAILEENTTFLSTVPGIGKKTASRLLLEIKPQIEKKYQSGAFKNSPTPEKTLFHEALQALTSLGYDQQKVLQILKKIMTSDEAPLALGDIIRSALKQLSA